MLPRSARRAIPGVFLALVVTLGTPAAFAAGGPPNITDAPEAWHAARALQPGDIIRADDIQARPPRYRPAPGRPAPISTDQSVIGLEMKRRLGPGQYLTDRDIGPPNLIRAGQPVRVFYRAGTLSIEIEGRALNSAGLGEEVRVANTQGGRTIRALVIAEGTAEVRAPSTR